MHALLLLIAVLLVLVAIWQWRKTRHIVAGVSVTVAVAVAAVYLATDTVAGDFTRMTPYVTTLLVLALASQRLRVPATIGRSYRRGQAG